MSGWKTWTAVITTLLYGIGFEGINNNNWTITMQYIMAALALLGIGGKLSKIENR